MKGMYYGLMSLNTGEGAVWSLGGVFLATAFELLSLSLWLYGLLSYTLRLLPERCAGGVVCFTTSLAPHSTPDGGKLSVSYVMDTMGWKQCRKEK